MVALYDEEATAARITAALTAQLKSCAEDEQFIFYYAGHGSRGFEEEDGGCFFFLPADGRVSEKALFSGADLFELIELHYRGSMALIFADCCYSG